MPQVASKQRKPVHDGRCGNQGVLLCLSWMQISEPTVFVYYPWVQRDQSKPSKNLLNILSLRILKASLGKQFFLSDDRIEHMNVWPLKHLAEEPKVEVVNQDICVRYELDFCHFLISRRKEASL